MKQRFLDWILQVDLGLEYYSDTGILRIGGTCTWEEPKRKRYVIGNEPECEMEEL